jgi:ADP-heptose:LPS heptosyltransferase
LILSKETVEFCHGALPESFEPVLTRQSGGGIVIAPQGAAPDLELPVAAWILAVRMLRTYQLPLYLMGDSGFRMDHAAFSEKEICSELPVEEKLTILHSADVVVGVPNVWLWAATSFEKRMIYFYPETIDQKQWFPWAHDNYYRIAHAPDNVQPAAVLAAIRACMNQL